MSILINTKDKNGNHWTRCERSEVSWFPLDASVSYIQPESPMELTLVRVDDTMTGTIIWIPPKLMWIPPTASAYLSGTWMAIEKLKKI